MKKIMWLTKFFAPDCPSNSSFYDLWRKKPHPRKGWTRLFEGDRGEAAKTLCARPFEKEHPDLKMRAGQICKVEVTIKRITKPEKVTL